MKFLKKRHQEKWENAYLVVAKKELPRLFTTAHIWLTALRRQNLGKFVPHRPYPGSAVAVNM